jgi:hypothetical protein
MEKLLIIVALLGYVISILAFMLGRKSTSFAKYIFYFQALANFIGSTVILYEIC